MGQQGERRRRVYITVWLALCVLALGACVLPLDSAAPTPILPGGALPPPPTPATPVPQPLTAADLAPLDAATQLAQVDVPLRDLTALRAALDPTIAAAATATAAAPAPAPSTYTVGDTTTFYVHNSDTAENRQITATLIHKTGVAYAWVETGQVYDADAIRAAIDRFSSRIYPADVAAFGREPSPGVDGDPRLHVLHTTGMGGAAGYFLGGDEVSRLGYPFSNEKEMFYISLEWMAMSGSAEVYETVLAHEFQHMIHAAHDANEVVWLSEGLSEYAKEAAGYAPRYNFAAAWAAQPATQLNDWGGATANNSAHYGAAYLFVRYLVQRFGPPIAARLVDEPADSIAGVNNVLAGYGVTFDDLFADWLVAATLDQHGASADNRFGYAELDPPLPGYATTVDAWPISTTASAPNFSPYTLALAGAGAATLHFDGGITTTLAVQAPPVGTRAWWANRSDNSEARLTRQFDLSALAPGAPVTVSVRTAWDIEPNYDYGYVFASRDGAAWAILPGQRTTSLNTAGNNLGEGFTGLSSSDAVTRGWVDEAFDVSVYAGGPLWLRFSYVTDDAVTRPGWWIDDLRIDAIGYADDFEGEAPGWISEGWLLTDGILAQDWLLQLLTLDGGQLTGVQRITVDAQGDATVPVTALGNGRTALLIISPITDGTAEPAAFAYRIE